MPTSEIVGSIFFAADELLGVKKLTICASSHFVYHRRFQVQEYATRYMLPSTGLAEEGHEGVISSVARLFHWQLTIRLHISTRLAFRPNKDCWNCT